MDVLLRLLSQPSISQFRILSSQEKEFLFVAKRRDILEGFHVFFEVRWFLLGTKCFRARRKSSRTKSPELFMED